MSSTFAMPGPDFAIDASGWPPADTVVIWLSLLFARLVSPGVETVAVFVIDAGGFAETTAVEMWNVAESPGLRTLLVVQVNDDTVPAVQLQPAGPVMVPAARPVGSVSVTVVVPVV
ncbi:MAG TPA: hypothetical protein VFX70_03030 [Mycobacteriales bacterium]|nr:hypothetical protein [Mycobacteriales bacterium]